MAGTAIDLVECRRGWLSNTEAEGRAWLAHIDRHAQRIHQLQEAVGQAMQHNEAGSVAPSDDVHMPTFETGDLLFNVFAFANWLAHIRYREDKHVKDPEMLAWLVEFTSWPFEACEAFWYCVRNPVMHTGRSFIFHDHDRKSAARDQGSIVTGKIFGDLHPDLTFDPLRFQPAEFKPTPSEDGFNHMPTFDKQGEFRFSFYFAGVRRKLDNALEIVLDDIRGAGAASMRRLIKVNMKIMAFRVAGPNTSAGDDPV